MMDFKNYLRAAGLVVVFLLINYLLITIFSAQQNKILSPIKEKTTPQEEISTSSGKFEDKVSPAPSSWDGVKSAEYPATIEGPAPSASPEPLESLSTTPPSSGYQQQQVQTDSEVFTVDIIAADLNATRVIVDTASEFDCHNDCPVLPLATYVARNGAFAGVNGSYFCPASYESCNEKKNAFDTLLMNKDKKYFNSENNIYSEIPAVIFSGNSARFVTASKEWGRDTSVDAVIANQPLLVLNQQLLFTGDDDYKRGVKSNRSFIGATDSTAYLGVVHNATVAESAKVIYSLGIKSALNLDSGGSTALWHEGYKLGPGRNIPNAVLLIKK